MVADDDLFDGDDDGQVDIKEKNDCNVLNKKVQVALISVSIFLTKKNHDVENRAEEENFSEKSRNGLTLDVDGPFSTRLGMYIVRWILQQGS